MSKLLNKYFLSVFTQENLSTLPEGVQVYKGNDNDMLKDVTITRQIVQEEIDKLKKNKSPGPDEIFPMVLKECKEALSGQLASMFNKSVSLCSVPHLWKVANVTPIFKKGNRSSTSN